MTCPYLAISMRPCVSDAAQESQKRHNDTHDRCVSCGGRTSAGVRTQQRNPAHAQSCKQRGMSTHAVAATQKPSCTSVPLTPRTVTTGGVATLVHAPSAGRHRLEGGACGTGQEAWQSAGERKHHTAHHNEHCTGSGWRLRWPAALTFDSIASAGDDVDVPMLVFLIILQPCSCSSASLRFHLQKPQRYTDLSRAAEF